MTEFPSDEEIEKVLELVSNGECTARWALDWLGYYFDHDLYMHLIALEYHNDVNDPNLRKTLENCKQRKAKEDCYNHRDMQSYEELLKIINSKEWKED